MARYLLQRLVGMLLMLIIISVVSYSMVRLLPGDPVNAIFGDGGDPAVMAAVRADLGLDQPAAQYYFVWLGRVLRGDFGRSIQSNKPVLETLRTQLIPTVELTIMASFVTLATAMPLGILSAVRRGSVLDWCASVFAVLGLSIP